jgi:hypothetical protein
MLTCAKTGLLTIEGDIGIFGDGFLVLTRVGDMVNFEEGFELLIFVGFELLIRVRS